MERIKKLFEKQWFANGIAICMGVFFYMILSHVPVIVGSIHWILSLLAPVFIGVILAYIIDPIVRFCEKKIFGKVQKEKTKRALSVVVGLIFVVLMIVLFFLALVPSLVESFSNLFDNRDTYAEVLEGYIAQINRLNIVKLDMEGLVEEIQTWLLSLVDYVSENSAAILTASKSFGSGVVNVGIGLILCIYYLLGKKSLAESFREFRKALLGEKKYVSHNDFWKKCNTIFLGYIGYNFLEAVLVGAINAIVMMILGLPYIALISVVVGVTNMIPTLGPVIGAVIGAFILVLNNPLDALWFLILTVVLQLIDGYIIKPKLFGNSLGLSPVVTLASITIGGKLMGIVGIFLAIPSAAIVSMIYKENFLPWLRKRSAKIEEEKAKSEEADGSKETAGTEEKK
ncbi:MAG: AI-2E family transporter [Lachnospiraceae bacterium]|nr:AI-2E family transporter [Lachnospiraceae bacterium]